MFGADRQALFFAVGSAAALVLAAGALAGLPGMAVTAAVVAVAFWAVSR